MKSILSSPFLADIHSSAHFVLPEHQAQSSFPEYSRSSQNLLPSHYWNQSALSTGTYKSMNIACVQVFSPGINIETLFMGKEQELCKTLSDNIIHQQVQGSRTGLQIVYSMVHYYIQYWGLLIKGNIPQGNVNKITQVEHLLQNQSFSTHLTIHIKCLSNWEKIVCN